MSGRRLTMREVDLASFFEPKRIVVIGASVTPKRPNSAMWRKISAWGAARGAEVIAVNHRFDDLDGVQCHRSMASVSGPIDLAVILVGDAVGILPEVLAAEPKFAVIFGAGFSETGASGAKLERRLDWLLRRSDTRLLGPNTNLNAFETFRDDLNGLAVTLITQSGHQGRPVFQAQELGIRLTHWAPTGNEVDLEAADFIRYFADLPTTGAIAAYIEGFTDGRSLILAADHAAQSGVPIVCVKVGRTEVGASMAASHTGHMTGSDRVITNVFRQFGVIRVDGLDELTDVSAALARANQPPRPKRRNVCVYAISGGTGAHMADMAAAAGLRLPTLAKSTRDELRTHIPGYLRVSNPVDSGGAPSADSRGPKILRAILDDPAVDLVICPITGALETLSMPLARDLVAAAETSDKPIFVVWGSPTESPAFRDVLCSSSKLAIFRSFGTCVSAAAAYFDHHEFVARYRSPFRSVATRRHPGAAKVSPLLVPGTNLAEFSSKKVLAAYGIPCGRNTVATSADLAAKAFRKSRGPVAMKISSADIAHKSDLGLVKLGVETDREVREQFERMVRRAGKRAPGAKIDGVLVTEMAPKGIECVVGVTRDPLFGPVVSFGAGGLLVELVDDLAIRVPPFGRTEARRMIDQTLVSKLLAGVRGAKPANVAAVIDVIMAVQRLAMDFADEISEIDINPLVVSPTGAVAVDALIVCG